MTFKSGMLYLITLLTLLTGKGSAAAADTVYGGKVVDESGSPVIGAGIIVKGNSAIGTVSDLDGIFFLEAPEGSTLIISALGYKEQSITPKGATGSLTVVLLTDSTMLEETVVVGYGTRKKDHLTGSVTTVSSKDLVKAPVASLSNMLTGKVAGLTSIQSSGRPGDDDAKLMVRGINTFNGVSNNGQNIGSNSPLVIVDGVERSMGNINPNDIESISVLKDASAAIYGVQGANGVILITTKKGSSDTPTIQFDASMTATTNTAIPEYLNAKDFMYYRNLAYSMDGLTPPYNSTIQNAVLKNDGSSVFGQTDWFDLVFRTGVQQQYNVSASGSSGKVRYYTSLGMMDQQGTVINTSYSRYNLRTNLDVELARNLSFSTNISAYTTSKNYPGYGMGDQYGFSPLYMCASTAPIIRCTYEDQYVGFHAGTGYSSYYYNPVQALTESGYTRENQYRIDTDYRLKYDFDGVLKGLSISVFGAYNYGHSVYRSFLQFFEGLGLDEKTMETVSYTSPGIDSSQFNKSFNYNNEWLLRPELNWNMELGLHSINLFAAYEATKFYTENISGSKKGYAASDPVDINLGTEYTDAPVGGSYAYTGHASYIGRLNYAYDGKYLLEAAFREDGTYVFAPENRWGFFPSVSAGWVISKEKFMSRASLWLDFLKLRASYGLSGNNDATPYLYNSTYNVTSSVNQVYGTTPVVNYYTTNPYLYRNLSWSTTRNINAGLDGTLWGGKLSFELEGFYQLTSGILEYTSGNYPPSLGNYYPSITNSGMVSNTGFEITLNHRNRLGELSYAVGGSFSFARNKVLRKAVTDNYPNYHPVLGAPMGTRYGFHAIGLAQTQEQIDEYPGPPSGILRLGDLLYEDYNGDGKLDSNQSINNTDYVRIGYGAIPEINFSFHIDLDWRDFYLTTLWQGVSHCDYVITGYFDSGVLSQTAYSAVFYDGGNTPYYLAEGSWTPDNPDAKYPRLSTVMNGNNAWSSDWWVINGEYLRLKQAQLGWNMPSSWLHKTALKGLKLYLAGTNLLTFSHFKYLDPESPSISQGLYPQTRTFSFGLNMTF